MRNGSIVIAGLLLCSVACDKDEKSTTESGAEVEQTGEEISKNPLKAMEQVAQAGKEIAAKAKEMEEREPVDPVKFDALIELLPSPSEWTATEPKGATQQMGQWKISEASRHYTKGEGQDQQKIDVTLVDGSYVPMVYAPFTAMANFAQESTEGYAKGMKIDGQPAFEEWKKKSKNAKLIVLVADRFLLTIEGSNVTPEVVRNWAGLIGTKKIAALAKAGK